MKNFELFNQDLNKKRIKDIKIFENAKLIRKIKPISEIFDSEELKSEWEIPWMQGDFGPEGEISRDLVKPTNITKNDELSVLHSNILLNVPFIIHFPQERILTSKNNNRLIYELTDFKITDETHSLKSRATIDISINKDGTYIYNFECMIKGITTPSDEYEMYKDSYNQSIVTFDDLTKSLTDNVFPKLKKWGEQNKKWFYKDPINSEEAKKDRNKYITPRN